MIGTITEYRSSWATLGDSVDADMILMDYIHETPEPLEQKTGIYPVEEYRFTGSNQVSSTRRPQGVAVYGDIIFNSWYFRSSSDFEFACKLTISDAFGHTDICPVQLDENNKFVRVDSHGSGIAILGDYLYLTDDNLDAIRVFSLNDIYRRSDILSAMADDDFPVFFDWVMPEVGRIPVTLPQSIIGYMSITNNEFLWGNFYYEGHETYGEGDDSYIYTLPVDDTATFEFAVPADTPTEIIAHYPNAHPLAGETIEQIQGAVKYGDDLILSCSWGFYSKTTHHP